MSLLSFQCLQPPRCEWSVCCAFRSVVQWLRLLLIRCPLSKRMAFDYVAVRLCTTVDVAARLCQATFNVRTLTSDGNILACALWAKEHGVGILVMQETHRLHDEDFMVGSGWRFLNFALTDGKGGVGAILSPDASRRLYSASGSSRHILLKFNVVSILGVYAPTAQFPDEREAFFARVTTLLPRDASLFTWRLQQQNAWHAIILGCKARARSI